MKSLPLNVLLVGLALVTLLGCQQIITDPPHDASVSMTIPQSVTIQQGKTQNVTVAVHRYNYTQPVTVSLSELPEGVSAKESSLSVTGDSATFVLTAGAKAKLVANHPVTVSIEGPGDDHGKSSMLLTVGR